MARSGYRDPRLLLFLVRYLTTLSVSRLHSIADRMINEYGGAGGMRIGMRNESTRRKPAPVQLCRTYLCMLLNSLGIIISRRLRLDVHVTRMEETRSTQRILVGKLLRKVHLEDRGDCTVTSTCLSRYHVYWQALVLAMLDLRVLLP
jgi:hypothetical protein